MSDRASSLVYRQTGDFSATATCRGTGGGTYWSMPDGSRVQSLPPGIHYGHVGLYDSEHFYRLLIRGAFAAWLLVCAPPNANAESGRSAGTSTASMSVRVVIPPVLRIIQIKALPMGREYRIWTNMRSVNLEGHAFRFSKVGEFSVVVPDQGDRLTLVHGL